MDRRAGNFIKGAIVGQVVARGKRRVRDLRGCGEWHENTRASSRGVHATLAEMDASVVEKIRELVQEGRGESVLSARFFPLVELDSGARVGLDAEARFAIALVDAAALLPFSPDIGHLFHEVLEWKRTTFDDALENGARAFGLPAIEVSLAFPASGIVGAVLRKNMHYTTRLALPWLRPSELRDVQPDLRRIVEDRTTPTSLRDFAARLMVRD